MHLYFVQLRATTNLKKNLPKRKNHWPWGGRSFFIFFSSIVTTYVTIERVMNKQDPPCVKNVENRSFFPEKYIPTHQKPSHYCNAFFKYNGILLHHNSVLLVYLIEWENPS